jgi:hypothetical protein
MTIESRLMWVESESGVPKLVERPQAPAPSEIPSVDDIIQMNDRQSVKQLQTQFKQTESQIDQQISYERQAILNQYEIKNADMKRRYDAAPAEKKQAILDQTLSFKSQALAKIQAINDKYAPAKDNLNKTLEAEMQKISQAAQIRNFRLQTVRQLVQAGHMDATHAKQAEYKLVGIDWRPPKSSRSEKAQLVTDIGNLDKMLERFTPGDTGEGIFNLRTKPTYLDPVTGETRKLNPKNEADAAIIGQMNNLIKAREDLRKKYQQTLLMENPSFRAAIEKNEQFRKAKAAHMSGTGNIETAVRQEVGKPKQTMSQMIRTLKEQGLGREEIKAQMINMGYK